MAKEYDVRPSEIVGLDCTYTAYCFDKACLYIKAKMEPSYDDKGKKKEGKTPVFPNERKRNNKSNDGLQMLFKHNKKAQKG